MGILIITNRFELGMLDESLTKTRGLAIGSPELYDLQTLYAEYRGRKYHNVHTELFSTGSYEDGHKAHYYGIALEHISRGNGVLVNTAMFPYSSHVFNEGDHIMVVTTNYDPVYSGEDFAMDLHCKIYLLSF